MSLTCQAKCLHRVNNLCGLLELGLPVILNGAGQCEMKEMERIHEDLVPCNEENCGILVTSRCTICDNGICDKHAYIHLDQFVCTICIMSYGRADYDHDFIGT